MAAYSASLKRLNREGNDAAASLTFLEGGRAGGREDESLEAHFAAQKWASKDKISPFFAA
jgi:hypothetical protein